MAFLSPLEQFEVINLLKIYFSFFDFSITNSTFFGFFSLTLFIFLLESIFISAKIVPVRWQTLCEGIYDTAFGLVYDNIGEKGKSFLTLIFTLFLFLLLNNLLGMIPYTFTITSHIILTFGLALLLFVGINIVCIKIHKIHFFSFFLPAGSDLMLAPLLIPIEIVSYFFRLISLPVRLFANMMTGHTLLKIIAGFAWQMMSLQGIFFMAHYLPLLLLVVLIGLELGVSIIQAYVFTILTCMYLNDAINLH